MTLFTNSMGMWKSQLVTHVACLLPGDTVDLVVPSWLKIGNFAVSVLASLS